MWSGKKKTWVNYANGVLAADVTAAVFLSGYMRNLRMARRYAESLEVIDLQRYRMVRKPGKVKLALQKYQTDNAFIFPVGKN